MLALAYYRQCLEKQLQSLKPMTEVRPRWAKLRQALWSLAVRNRTAHRNFGSDETISRKDALLVEAGAS